MPIYYGIFSNAGPKPRIVGKSAAGGLGEQERERIADLKDGQLLRAMSDLESSALAKKLNSGDVIEFPPLPTHGKILLISLNSEQAVVAEVRDTSLDNSIIAANVRTGIKKDYIHTTRIGHDKPDWLRFPILGEESQANAEEALKGMVTVRELLGVVWHEEEGGKRDPRPQVPPSPGVPLPRPRREVRDRDLIPV